MVFMIDIPKTIAKIEKAADKQKITMQRLCAIAGISQSTWTRAKHGKQEIRFSTLQKVEDALERLKHA